jgi:hypothetical protein
MPRRKTNFRSIDDLDEQLLLAIALDDARDERELRRQNNSSSVTAYPPAPPLSPVIQEQARSQMNTPKCEHLVNSSRLNDCRLCRLQTVSRNRNTQTRKRFKKLADLSRRINKLCRQEIAAFDRQHSRPKPHRGRQRLGAYSQPDERLMANPTLEQITSSGGCPRCKEILKAILFQPRKRD